MSDAPSNTPGSRRSDDGTGPLPNLPPQVMGQLADHLDETMNGTAAGDAERTVWGFALLTFAFQGPGLMSVQYVSNAHRDSIIPAMRAWLAQVEGEGDPGSEEALRAARPAGFA